MYSQTVGCLLTRCIGLHGKLSSVLDIGMACMLAYEHDCFTGSRRQDSMPTIGLV
jgi:hypothetical protein